MTRAMQSLMYVIAKWYESTANHIWFHLLIGIGSWPLKPVIGVRAPVESPFIFGEVLKQAEEAPLLRA